MQITGMKWGAKLLKYVDFPAAEILGAEAKPEEIQALIDKYGGVLVKPVFKGGIGKKGKAGLVGKATDVRTALKEKERLYFAEHRHGNAVAKSEGVTYESFIKAEYEVYFSLTDSTLYRAPTMTITHHGGVDIEELPADKIISVPFDPLTGLKGFVISNALSQLGAPNEIISPLVQNLTKLWDLFHNYGMTVLELNPIRIARDANGRLTPVACDFKCSFDGDDPNMDRLGLPDDLDNTDLSEYESAVNQLRTYQGQSDVFVINPTGSVTAMTFGGGANALVTELLGDVATISSDFGGNPPYAKMKEISRITYQYWLPQTNVLFIIGGKANNTDIYETFRAMGDALREHFTEHGPTPLYVVVGRGGPNLIRGLGYLRDIMDALGLPYAMFGFDSAMSEVINHAMAADKWMKAGGRKLIAQKLGIR
ncbi:MAG: carboxylate--amine ligase [Magnetococcales bacterium]|nr:carboxylate--amine ligase [Magnetococcales bacterium]